MEPVTYSHIDSKEIRGLNVRNLIAIIIATISIVTTVLATKSSLEGQIRDLMNNQATFGKINDMNFKIYDAKFENIQKQIDEINGKIEKITNDKDYQKK